MKNIAIIPARSGSKGLKDKNIRSFDGKPLLAWSVEAAVSSGCYDTVHVSTDSEEYAKIAREFGADVPFLRSAALSGDTADSWDVMTEVLNRYAALSGEFDTLTILQPTSPLRSGEDIIRAFELYREKNADAVVSVCEADHPPEWYQPLGENGELSAFDRSERTEKRRQEFETRYRINGAVYLISVPYFREDPHHIYRGKAFAYIMDKRSSVDIDDLSDFELAELLHRQRLDILS